MTDLEFFRGKRVLVTGHTGFKGSWLCRMLIRAGADLTGYALNAPEGPGLFSILRLEDEMDSVCGDVRDLAHLQAVFQRKKPEIVLHLAAQPIVRESYENPVYTYETNVMGTVHVLECVRRQDCVRSFVNVTTDKVYRNREWEWGYREEEELDGFDPYSNSKSCSELVTGCYRNSFFDGSGPAVSTAWAGNVIGGGDFARDRIVPDCIRGAVKGEEIIVRNPYSVRPYQHVLEPAAVYLMIAGKQYENPSLAGSYNVGPGEEDCLTTGELVNRFCDLWNRKNGLKAGSEIRWKDRHDGGPHEANFLKLDCSRLKARFGWRPVWNIDKALEKTVEWFTAYASGGDLIKCVDEQIDEFINAGKDV